MTDESYSLLHSSNSNDRVQKSNGASLGHSNSSASTNPRSCVTCRKRKVKCDKKQPCSNCTRAKIECIFPSPGRAPRKSRKPADGELMERLRRLEGVVQTLNAQVEEGNEAHSEEDISRRSSEINGCPNKGIDAPSVAVDNTVEGLESRFGRLVVDQGRSRYINNSFWASLNNEVEDLQAILIEPSDDEDEDKSTPESSRYDNQHQSFIFGYSSSSVDMLQLHPTADRAREYFDIYKENVDPLVKVLHLPTIGPKLLEGAENPAKVPKGLECLMFAVYYGAVTSVLPQECFERFGEERTELLNKYRFALEQSLARANFLYCDEMIILQAFVVFLILLRRNDDARKIWTLTGLVVRIAQTLGIHRDGSHFNLPPFEIEMRRRLWWQVCILDARSSEDHGCDPTIVEAQFDTKMPLNVNDADLDPDMKDFPEDRVGFTEMTFCIIRYEVANIFRRILYIPPGPNRCNQFFANLTIPEKERWISDCHQRLEEKYLKHCDMSVPLYWVTATIARLVMSKMWLVVYHPHQRRDGGASLPQETKDKLFITSLENIEYSILLETEARTMKWGWLFRTYVQWHAIAFLLSELCVRTKGEAVERAWRALEATAGRWWFPLNSSADRRGRQGCLWKPLRKLMAKARAARERELALERAAAALRGQPLSYQDIPQLLDQPIDTTGFSNTQSQQPYEQLDAMLQPAAPRLGEMPSAQPPSGSFVPPPSQTGLPARGMSGTSHDNPVIAEFQELTSMGLDYFMHDMMGIEASYGEDLNARPLSDFTPSTNTIGSHTTNEMSGVNGSRHNTQSTTSPNNSSGQSSNSPLLGDGTLDWANWDDMVQQYGMDVDATGSFPAPANTNGASYLGMPTWY